MTIAAPPKPTTESRRTSTRPESPGSKIRRRAGDARWRTLGRLETAGTPARELIARRGAAGSTLVIDRDAASGADERLIAHLPADEPAENAALLCSLYAEAPPELRRCRPVTGEDRTTIPLAPSPPAEVGHVCSLEGAGALWRLQPLPSRMLIPELRWSVAEPSGSGTRAVSLRDVIAALEDYEPMCAITSAAIAGHSGDERVSTTTLRAELCRVLESPIVLNRRLREAVLEHVERNGSSLSEIAIRCGRVKRDSRGGESGETSWLARRIGILPEGGQSNPTVWVHSDVLGLIARQGLGLSPLEVELA